MLVIVAASAWKAWGAVSSMFKCLPEIERSSARIASSIDKYLIVEDTLKGVPAIMEGQMKMCVAQVAAIAELRKTVKGLQEAIFKRDDIRSLETPSDGEKNIAWEAKRIQSENPGMDISTAMMKAIEEEAKELSGASGGFQL